MSKQNEALEKNNTTAGKLAEVLAIADQQAEQIRKLTYALTLITEVHPTKNSHEDYVQAVLEIARTALESQ